MLSIGKLALGQHRYYEQQVARGADDYYAGRGEAPGEWVGAGAQVLGLAGRVSAAQFGALIAGLDPGEPSVRLRASRRDPKVAALDLTFSAPKSVSVLAAAGHDELARELIVAHEQAVRAALSYLEVSAVQVRRGHDGMLVQKGEGLIAAAYRHRMSRALDPQLHTHVVAANLTRGPDGRYTALHGTPLYRAAKTAGYLYQAQLRALVSERLGLRWGPVRKGAAELRGVPAGVLAEFSKRRHEMLREAQRGGIGLGSKAAAERAAVATRERKRYGVDTHSWREEVGARAGELGLGTREMSDLLEAGRRAREEASRVRPLDERALGDALAGPHGLTEHANCFDQRAVLQQFAAAAAQGASVPEISERTARFLGREDVLATATGAFTTTELVECERALIATALGCAREGIAVLDGETAANGIARKGGALSDEQRAVVGAVVASGRGVEVIEALAGAGKTHIAAALGELYRDAGYEVIGVAPTGRAVRELTEHGVAARTLDRTLIDIESSGGRLPNGTVVVFDEAGMAPTRASARLLKAAARAGAKVVAIGDPGQLASVQAGGWLGFLGRELGSLRLREVMRQRDPGERRVLAALHEGLPSRYLEWAQREGRIEIFSEREDALQRAVGEWAAATESAGVKQAVMIARDNDTRTQLNDAARELWRALGLLGAERAYGCVSLAVGDRVICRRNDAVLDLDNGMRGTVRHVEDDRVVIDTDGQLPRELPAAYIASHVEHAYALTGHGMQGATVERAIVLVGPRELTAGWSYTALSRARDSTRLLIHAEAPARDRREVGPSERGQGEPKDLLARVAGRMLERDDEPLAIEQLPPAGRADDRALELAERLAAELPQEQPAARNELHSNPPARGTLAAIRDQLERLCAQRDALPVRRLTRLDDLDTRLGGLEQQRDRLANALAALPDVPQRRFGRTHDPQAIERGRLTAALKVHDQALDEARSQRAPIERELGDPQQARSERDGLERAIDELMQRAGALREQARERERDAWELGLPTRERALRADHDLGLER